MKGKTKDLNVGFSEEELLLINEFSNEENLTYITSKSSLSEINLVESRKVHVYLGINIAEGERFINVIWFSVKTSNSIEENVYSVERLAKVFTGIKDILKDKPKGRKPIEVNKEGIEKWMIISEAVEHFNSQGNPNVGRETIRNMISSERLKSRPSSSGFIEVQVFIKPLE